MTTETTRKIKSLGSERNGEALIELMDFYKVNRLMDISEEQGQEYYKMKTEELKNDQIRKH